MFFCPKCNNIYDITKSTIKDANDQDVTKEHFICSSCGFTEQIKPGTLLFSKTSKNLAENYESSNIDNMKYSDILHRTRRYKCSNPKCITHKEPEKKEAVFFRKNNTFKIQYICLACDTPL